MNFTSEKTLTFIDLSCTESCEVLFDPFKETADNWIYLHSSDEQDFSSALKHIAGYTIVVVGPTLGYRERCALAKRLSRDERILAGLFVQSNEDAERFQNYLTFSHGITRNLFTSLGDALSLQEATRTICEFINKSQQYRQENSELELSIEEADNLLGADLSLVEQKQFLFDVLMHSLRDHVYFKDTEGRFIMVNYAMADWVGVSTPEDLVGKSDFDLFGTEHAEQARMDEELIVRKGKTISNHVEQEEHLDGRMTWVRTDKHPLRLPNGKIIGIVGISRDITVRKTAEILLERERLLLRTLVDILPFRVFAKDSKGDYLLTNRKHAQVLGVESLEELKAKQRTKLPPEQNGALLSELESEVLRTGRPILNHEERDSFSDSDEAWILFNLVPFRDSAGEMLGLVGASIDISENKQKELRLRKQGEVISEGMEMAREVQRAMLPPGLEKNGVTSCELTPKFLLTYGYQPSVDLAGDFLEIIPLGDNCIGVLVGDVMGHGLRGAMVSALIIGLAEELTYLAYKPDEFMTQLNSKLSTILSRAGSFLFVTALYAVIDLDRNVMSLTNAGHLAPICIVRSNGESVAHVDEKNYQRQPALGMIDNFIFEACKVTWEEEGRLLMFTDGIIEATNEAGEEWGKERFQDIVKAHIDHSAESLIGHVLTSVKEFTQSDQFQDDVCLVCIEGKIATKMSL